MPGCAGRWRCRNPVAWRYAAGPGLIVGQSGGPPLKSTQIVPYVPVCRPRFPGARVIVGHPRLHLTRMAHDQEKHPKTSRAKRGKSGQVRCAGGAIPPPGPRSRPGRPAGCCRHLPEMRTGAQVLTNSITRVTEDEVRARSRHGAPARDNEEARTTPTRRRAGSPRSGCGRYRMPAGAGTATGTATCPGPPRARRARIARASAWPSSIAAEKKISAAVSPSPHSRHELLTAIPLICWSLVRSMAKQLGSGLIGGSLIPPRGEHAPREESWNTSSSRWHRSRSSWQALSSSC